MKAILDAALLLVAISALPAALASMCSSHQLMRHLRTAHPEIWAKIAPPPGVEPSLSSSEVRFVTQRTYRQIEDPVLQRLGDRAYRHLYLAGGVFLILVLSLLARAQ